MKIYFAKLRVAAAFAAACIFFDTATVPAAILTFDSLEPATNASTRTAWLTAIGISTPKNLVNFESGFTDNQNVSGVGGLFPDGLVITDTGPGSPAARIESNAVAGSIADSNGVGAFTLEHDQGAFLELDFSANPVDYLGLLDIDHGLQRAILTFVDNTTAEFTFDQTESSGDSAEFVGIFRNDMPRIKLVQFRPNGSDGDGWGIDNIEYGQISAAAVPEPSTLAMFATAMMSLVAHCRFRRAAI